MSNLLTAAPITQKLPFLGHLAELRRRLIYSLIAVAVCTAISFHLAPMIFEFLRRPLLALPTQKMLVLNPLEMFITYIKLAVLSGVFVASPFVCLQCWYFIAPGLHPRERRFIVPCVLLASVSFAGGAAFCFFCVLPASFAYLVDMVPLGIEAHYSVSSYFSLVTQLMLAFGIVFELPLAMIILAAAGIIKSATYARIRKYWLIVAVLLGGILTPTPDPLTQMMMAIPLVLFFELGIVGARAYEKQRKIIEAGL